MQSLVFQFHEHGPHALTVRGEIDLASAPNFSRALGSVTRTDLVVDCSGIAFFGASGVRVLVEACDRAQGRGQRLMLDAPPLLMRRVLAICELSELVVTPSVARDQSRTRSTSAPSARSEAARSG